jgi:5-methylcytosine-specific restriction endonuclease McrA
MEPTIDEASIETDLQTLDLPKLFRQVDKIGSKRYHRLTSQDFEDYRCYEHWRYIQGDGELGTTSESKKWVEQHSTNSCPICNDYYGAHNVKNIDHKLPRAQYPWLSLNFQNFWVICRACNLEKAEMNWYEYERYMMKNYADRYQIVRNERPEELLKSLLAEHN